MTFQELLDKVTKERKKLNSPTYNETEWNHNISVGMILAYNNVIGYIEQAMQEENKVLENSYEI